MPAPKPKTKRKNYGRPSSQPQDIDADTWYYEYRGKIHVVAWRRGYDSLLKAHDIIIPMKMLRATIARMTP